VGAAFPYPPFNGMPGDSGLDIDLMHAIGAKLGAEVEFVPYEGADFNGILDALSEGAYDCVAAGTTVTPERERKAMFAPPYVISGQALAVDTRRHPRVRSVDDLAGLTVGGVDDLAAGRCDAAMALAPVLTELVKPLPGVEVVQRGITVENIAVAVALGDRALLSRITVAQAELEDDGTLQRIRRKWLGNPYTDQSLAVH
jgi:polar amino acid transport system substrate-binding protein